MAEGEFDPERFSRWVAYVLRHNPSRYGLEPDRHGYVDIEAFLRIARRRYAARTLEQLRALIEARGERFEMTHSRLRARYGHSIAAEPVGPPVEPPERLYHGTDAARIESIRATGLLPSDRRMLHLSETAEEALQIARRHSPQPALWRVSARDAASGGVAFYREGRVHLTAHLPPRFLALEA